ncbi:recombinase family protein [Stappia sp. ES.058]|uniref:recombinase family protein n=1 Tax=Stappia sp. ES.058 TaxID=1881061 RepID=UPI0012FD5B43|nr:recombinase family protein [Stappia sp. ES.058]
MSRGALHLILRNQVYRGKITHKGNNYPATHAPIIAEALWEEVQQCLVARNRRLRSSTDAASIPTGKNASSLMGRVFDAAGHRWSKDLLSGRVPSLAEIARREGRNVVEISRSIGPSNATCCSMRTSSKRSRISAGDDVT